MTWSRDASSVDFREWGVSSLSPAGIDIRRFQLQMKAIVSWSSSEYKQATNYWDRNWRRKRNEIYSS